MEKANLYLVCPDCQMEHVIENEFGNNVRFLTALGSVFDFSEFGHANMLISFLEQEGISDIVIVNDTHCTFIENTLYKNNNFNTIAEKQLERLLKNNSEDFTYSTDAKQKIRLAKLNIYRQAYELLDVAFVGEKINHGLISMSGLLYDRNTSKFERIALNL